MAVAGRGAAEALTATRGAAAKPLPVTQEEPKDSSAAVPYGCLIPATLLLIFLFYLVCFVMLVLGNANFLSVLLGLVLGSFFAFIPLLVLLPLLMWIDRFEPEPPRLIFIAFFGGGIISTLLALFFQIISSFCIEGRFEPYTASLLSTSIIAPLTEEPAKALIVLSIFFFFQDEFDGVLDGIVYGTIVGLGFEAFENLLYFSGEFASGGFGSMLANFVVRWFLGALGHAYYTGAFGIALGLTQSVRSRILKLPVALIGLIAAMFLHGYWNLVCTVEGSCLSILLLDFFLLLPCFIMFGVAVYLSLKVESRVISTLLKEEVASGLMSQGEYHILSSVIRRFRKGYSVFSTGGFALWKKYRTLVHAHTKLAFLKHHVILKERRDPKLLQRITKERAFIESFRNNPENAPLLSLVTL